jgi:AraC-like DNA-binding protein
VRDYGHVHKKDLIHLVYPALNLFLNIGQEYFHVLENPFIENIRFVSLVAFFLFYLVLSFNILYKNLWKESLKKTVATTHYLLIKKWTLFVFLISLFLVFRILYSIYSEKVSNELFQAHKYSFLVIIPWLLVYGKILVNPEILYGYPKLKKRIMKIENQVNSADHVWIFDLKGVSNPKDKKLSHGIKEKAIPYISDIENFVEKEHPFRSAKFSFVDFAKAIRIPTSHLYYIFKYHAIVSFVEYKNYCKIKDALQLINGGDLDVLTLEGLASKVGFSSYNSFFMAFKKQTRLAPKEYLTNKKDIVLYGKVRF